MNDAAGLHELLEETVNSLFLSPRREWRRPLGSVLLEGSPVVPREGSAPCPVSRGSRGSRDLDETFTPVRLFEREEEASEASDAFLRREWKELEERRQQRKAWSEEDTLLAEKKALQRELGAFESAFERQYMRKPKHGHEVGEMKALYERYRILKQRLRVHNEGR